MGSEISKSYIIAEQPSASGGNACLWRIYSAKSKTTGEKVSIWVFNKSDDLKDLADKTHRERIMDILRREVNVIKTMRHPSIVNVIETFEEARAGGLAFVTERVRCSLANAMGHIRHIPPNSKAAISARELGTMETYEVSRGIASLTEALKYVNTISRRLHLNISPESVFLSTTGVWKLAGFGYSIELPKDGGESTPCPHFHGVSSEKQYSGQWRLAPLLQYSSPEATAPLGEGLVSPLSDAFSIGCLAFEAFLRRSSNANMRDALGLNSNSSPRDYTEVLVGGVLQQAIYNADIPDPARQLVLGLTAPSAQARISIERVLTNPVFYQAEVVALRTIDMLGNRDPAEAATFLKSFRTSLSTYPLRVQRDIILISILTTGSTCHEGKLWSFILPVAGDICFSMTATEVSSLNIPEKLISALSREEPETLRSLVDLVPLLLKQCSLDYIGKYVVPMICKALTKDEYPELQEAALNAISEESFCEKADSAVLENQLLPRICWVAVKSEQLSSRVNALMCLAKIFNRLEAGAVVSKVMPTLKFAIEKDKAVAVQLCCLGCYEAISKWIPNKAFHISSHILPAVTPILVHAQLNTKQFEMVAAKIQELVGAAIIEQRAIVLAEPNGRIPSAPVARTLPTGGKSTNKGSDSSTSTEGYAARIASGLTNSVTSMFAVSNKSKTSSIGQLETKPSYKLPTESVQKSLKSTYAPPTEVTQTSTQQHATPFNPTIVDISKSMSTNYINAPLKSSHTLSIPPIQRNGSHIANMNSTDSSINMGSYPSVEAFNAFQMTPSSMNNANKFAGIPPKVESANLQLDLNDFTPLKRVDLVNSGQNGSLVYKNNSQQSLENQLQSTQKEIDDLRTLLNGGVSSSAVTQYGEYGRPALPAYQPTSGQSGTNMMPMGGGMVGMNIGFGGIPMLPHSAWGQPQGQINNMHDPFEGLDIGPTSNSGAAADQSKSNFGFLR